MDSTSVELKNYESGIKSKALKIGLLKYDRNGVDEEVNKAIVKSVEILRKLGHEVEEIELPLIEYSVPCYYILVPAEISANLARFDGVKYGLFVEGKNLLEDYMKTRAEGFGRETKRRIMLGTYVLSAGYYDEYYGRAQKVRILIRKSFKDAFEKFDLLFSPVSPTPAFKIGEKIEDPLKMYLEDIFTASAKIAGVPAVSVPAGQSPLGGTLPIGIQFIASWFREDLLFNIAKQYEQNS